MTTDFPHPQSDHLIAYVIVQGSGDQSNASEIHKQMQDSALQIGKILMASFIDHQGQINSGLDSDFEECVRLARENDCPILIQNAHHLPDLAFQQDCSGLSFVIAELNQTVSIESLKLIRDYHAAQNAPVQIKKSGITHPEIEILLGYKLSNPDFVSLIGRAVESIRKNFEVENGWPFPTVHICDSHNIDASSYRLRLFDKTTADFQVFPDKLLALSTDPSAPELDDSVRTIEPTFQLPAFWIDPSLEHEAHLTGYTVITPAVVLITHLKELFKSHQYDLYTPKAFQSQYKALQRDHDDLLNLLHQCGVTTGQLHHLFKTLANDQIPICDNYNMLTELIEGAVPGYRFEDLIKAARRGLKYPISQSLTDEFGVISAVMFSSGLTDKCATVFNMTEATQQTAAMNQLRQKLIEQYRNFAGQPIILICSSRIDEGIRHLMKDERNHFFAIYTYDEFPTDAPIEVIEVIEI